LVADSAPDNFSKQSYVSALGGTQSGVNVHSVAIPFTLGVRRPNVLKVLMAKFLNGITGKYTRVPKNVYTFVTRKGVAIQSGQYETMIVRTSIEVPAGADSYDAANVRAGLSAHTGLVWAQASGAGDTCVTGSLG
jgi:hypothetical protein